MLRTGIDHLWKMVLEESSSSKREVGLGLILLVRRGRGPALTDSLNEPLLIF